MIKQCILGIFCGIIGTLFIAQNDPWIHQQLGNAFKEIYARTFHCTVTGTVETIDFIHPRIVFSNFSLSSSDENGTWSWTAQQFQTGFSWSFFLLHRTLDVWVIAKDLAATTNIHNGIPSIAPHIQALMRVPNLPIKIIVKYTQVQNASLAIVDDKTQIQLCWDSSSKRTPCKVASHFCLKGGIFTYQQQTLAHSLRGTLDTEVNTKPQEKESTLTIDGHIDLPQLGNSSTCSVVGTWHNDQGRFAIQSADKRLHIDPLILTQKKDDTLQFNVSALFPLTYCINLLTKQNNASIHGSCTLNAQGSLDSAGSCEGSITCEDITNRWFSDHTNITCSFKKQHHDLQGSVHLCAGIHASCHGLFEWKGNSQSGSCHLYNAMQYPLPYIPNWFINPHNATVDITYHKPTNILGLQYQARATNNSTNNTFNLSGSFNTDDQQHLNGTGTFGSYTYQLSAIPQSPYLTRCTLSNSEGTSLATVSYDAAKNRHISNIAISLMRIMGEKIFNHEMHGEGTIQISSHVKNNILYAQVQLKDATIRLPQTYNFITGFNASIEADIFRKRISLHRMRCTLNSGSLYSPHLTVWLDGAGKLQFAHAPILLDHCLFTVKQDLFTMISGYLLFAKQPDTNACLTGHILFDRSQLKENLFSQQEQKKLFNTASSLQEIPQIPLTCNLSIETKDPIRVDTRYLQADAEVHLHISDTVTKPRVSGSITVPSGTINFPYKPLQICKGEITFFEDQLFNPSVELIAKNRINNHNITLNVAGSVQNHAILLEASPPLTDEQIVNLLLTGAHEESLTAVIPALLMQNISDFIFSSHKSDFFDRYIKPFMKRIRVQLKPEFNDQTGRGGLRGALEISVNERWRALIEKNFSLTEDTRFELEYMLSDEVTFRAIRDERRDVGGEVEMKWKF